MGNFQNEHRKQPAADRFGKPGTAYPTANPFDVVITTHSSIAEGSYEPVIYGTPHFKVAAARLCFQAATPGDNSTKNVTRIYANPRLAQEPHNLVQGDDDANDPLYPVFVRSYLLPRGYTKGTIGSALTALIGLTLVSGGTGYTPTAGSNKLPLAFSGGDGSGAAGYAEIVAGAVVAVLLTNTGTGYTSAPTVTISGGGGSGASITALLQPTTAKLTNETEQPAEDPYGGYFVRVQRTWETLPGKVVTVSQTVDTENSASRITVTRTKKLASSITAGYALDGSSVTKTEKQDIDGITAYEIVTTIEESPYQSDITSKVKEKRAQYAFPSYILSYGEYLGITYTAPDFFGDGVGVRGVETQNATHTFKTWWVHSLAKPTLFVDEITMDDLGINNKVYKCLHDDITRAYGAYVVTVPATVPSMTEYYGTVAGLSAGSPPPDPFDPGTAPKWIGTEKTVLGGVENDGHPYRWRVDAGSLFMR